MVTIISSGEVLALLLGLADPRVRPLLRLLKPTLHCEMVHNFGRGQNCEREGKTASAYAKAISGRGVGDAVVVCI